MPPRISGSRSPYWGLEDWRLMISSLALFPNLIVHTPQYPTRWLARVCRAGRDVASLGTARVAGLFAFRDRALFLPHPDRFPHHADPSSRSRGWRTPRQAVAA